MKEKFPLSYYLLRYLLIFIGILLVIVGLLLLLVWWLKK